MKHIVFIIFVYGIEVLSIILLFILLIYHTLPAISLLYHRHFHYIPEVLASCFWCFPGFPTDALPYYYPIYLSILLIDRSFRDDARCRAKYGKYWDEYCEVVPAKVIPGVV